ncbi:MAG: GTPase ObgE [Anaerolineales bacterium]|nr:GTPase ObgE [Anaerolineae bacterium]PWB50871.1 MAG: GTPase ObgE [Anaerolineales bacterium]
MFIDEAEIYVKSGKGGDGSVHFRREKYIPRGGPDGGDGGRGGDVIFKVSPILNTLQEFQHQHRFIAPDGKPGAKSNRTGHSAEHLVITVPPGTIIYNVDDGKLIADLVDADQEVVLCKGGRGGRGNARFANSRDQAPRMAEKGAPGEERNLRLELRLIADVGIIGVPNAGKSTLLAAITNAKPKIADYPFTTIEPNLGVAVLDGERTLILADIPGLIEGAHMGTGLGFEFLRHIQRTRVLIHLLDGLAEDPLLDYAQINSELALFDPDLAKKPQVVALNKSDLPDVQARWESFQRKLKKKDISVMAVSAATGTNVKQMLSKAYDLLREAPVIIPEESLPVYSPVADPRRYEIKRISDGWRISGPAIERAAAMTYWDNDASIRRFQRILQALGIDKDLRKAGVKEGDMVSISDYVLEWMD